MKKAANTFDFIMNNIGTTIMNNIGTTIMAVIGLFAGFILLVFGFSLLLSLPTMWLWNWIMPIVFGLKTITWMQARGVSILSSILFKGHTTSK